MAWVLWWLLWWLLWLLLWLACMLELAYKLVLAGKFEQVCMSILGLVRVQRRDCIRHAHVHVLRWHGSSHQQKRQPQGQEMQQMSEIHNIA